MQTAEQMANAVLLKEMIKSAFDMPKWDPNISGALMGGTLGGLGGAAAGYLVSDKEKKNTLRNMLLGGGLGAAALGGIGAMKDTNPAADVESSTVGELAARAADNVKNAPASVVTGAAAPVAGYGAGRLGAGMYAKKLDMTEDLFLKNMLQANPQGHANIGAKFTNKKLGNIVQALVNFFSGGPSRRSSLESAIDKNIPESIDIADVKTAPRADVRSFVNQTVSKIGTKQLKFINGQFIRDPFTAADAASQIRIHIEGVRPGTIEEARLAYTGGPEAGAAAGTKVKPTGSIARAGKFGGRVGGLIGLPFMLSSLVGKNPDVNMQ